MRIFIATLGTETNTFASFPTGLEDFHDCFWSDGDIASATPSPWSGPGQTWLGRAQAEGWEVVQSLFAFANPAGPTTRTAYETMRDRILTDLEKAGPVDAVLMFLHGAMIADGYDDCEADLVTRIRAIVGQSVRIGLELDLHAHIDQVLVDAADLIVFYKTYPHIDHNERAHEVFDLMKRTLDGEIEPKMALFDCRSIGLFPTTMEGPMPAFCTAMAEAEGRDGILSLSLNHGFPWADLPQAGVKMLAVVDRDQALAERVAQDFGHRFYAIRAGATLPFTSFDEAIAEAGIKGEKPLVIADTSDQIGSGAPGDTTYVLKALIDAGISNAAVVPLWDPLAVKICFQVGVGARLKLRIGGKYEPHSGPPLDVDAEVLHLSADSYQGHIGDERVRIGDVAVVRVNGIEVLLTTLRTNLYSLDLMSRHGIEFSSKQVVSIKNLYKQKDLFEPISRKQLFVATPGTSNPDWKAIPFKRLQRPIWPLDEDPLGLDG